MKKKQNNPHLKNILKEEYFSLVLAITLLIRLTCRILSWAIASNSKCPSKSIRRSEEGRNNDNFIVLKEKNIITISNTYYSYYA